MNLETAKQELRKLQNRYGQLLYNYNTEITGHLLAATNARQELAETFAIAFQEGQRAFQLRAANLSTHTDLISKDPNFDRRHFAGMEQFRALVEQMQIDAPKLFETPRAAQTAPLPSPIPLFEYFAKAA